MIKLSNLSLAHLKVGFTTGGGDDFIDIGPVSDIMGSESYDILSQYDSGTKTTPLLKTELAINGSANEDPDNNGTDYDVDVFRIGHVSGREIVQIEVNFLSEDIFVPDMEIYMYQGPSDFSSNEQSQNNLYYKEETYKSFKFTYYTPDSAESDTIHYLKIVAPDGITVPLQYTIKVSIVESTYDYPTTTDVTSYISDSSSMTDNVFVQNEVHYGTDLVHGDFVETDGWQDVDSYKFTVASYSPSVTITIQADYIRFLKDTSFGISLVRGNTNIGSVAVPISGDVNDSTPASYSFTFYGILPGTYYIQMGY